LCPDLPFPQVIFLIDIKTMVEVILKNLDPLYQRNRKETDEQKLIGFADHAKCSFIKLGKGQQTIKNKQWDKHTQHTVKTSDKGTKQAIRHLLNGLLAQKRNKNQFNQVTDQK